MCMPEKKLRDSSTRTDLGVRNTPFFSKKVHGSQLAAKLSIPTSTSAWVDAVCQCPVDLKPRKNTQKLYQIS